MAETPGMLIVISGPSGSGKGTVVKALCKNERYALSISVTTRQKRDGETDGQDYFFCSPEAFLRMRQNHELLESAEYVGHYYGTPRQYVEQRIGQGKAVVLEIEVDGALQVKAQYPDAVLIFLVPPTLTALTERLTQRNTEDATCVARRLQRAFEEIALIDRYDYLVINEEVTQAVACIDTIVAAESLRPKHNPGVAEQFMKASDRPC